jgi:hypothetical protein
VEDAERTAPSHRLHALEDIVRPLVVQGVPERVYLKLDSGEKRRAADWLASGSYGEPNAKVFAASLKILWQWEQGAICKNDHLLMWRNWLRGARDMYLARSQDGFSLPMLSTMPTSF